MPLLTNAHLLGMKTISGMKTHPFYHASFPTMPLAEPHPSQGNIGALSILTIDLGTEVGQVDL